MLLNEVIKDNEQIYIRNKKDGGWNFEDNEMVNFYVKYIGVSAYGVYGVLRMYADKKQRAFPSLKNICEKLNILLL